MISCEDAIRELWGYLAHEMAPEDRHQVAEHLEACRRCCGELEFLGELRQFVAAAHTRLPPEVGDRMEAFLTSLEGSDGRPDAQD